MFGTRAIMTVAVATAVALVPTVANASAPDPATKAKHVAGLIAKVAPNQGVPVKAAAAGDRMVAAAGTRTASVPRDAHAPVVLQDAGGVKVPNAGPGQPSLAVSLPPELALDAGVLADDGTVVFSSTAGEAAAVQLLGDGTVRLETVIGSVAAPHRFTYEFGNGVVPVLRPDGSADLNSTVGTTTATLGRVAEPWAFDAKGRAVPTSYSIVNGALVQTVHTTADTAYPVVADPSVTFGWAVYYHYSRDEVRAAAQQTPYMMLSTVICEVVSGGLGTAFCLTAIGGMATSIHQTFSNAAANGQCVVITMPYYPSAATFALQMRWRAVSC